MKVKVAQSCRLSVTPQTIQSMQFSRPQYWSGQPFLSPEDLPNPGIQPRSPTLQVDSLPAEPQGKPKNTGMDSLSLLQQIVLTQESNWGLVHCRWTLYQLSYQGSPISSGFFFGRTLLPVGSQSPNQGANLCPPKWKHEVFNSGPPGKSPKFMIFKTYRPSVT